MATKTWSKEVGVTCYFRPYPCSSKEFGPTGKPAFMSLIDYVKVTAEFNREKPKRLLPTDMTIVRRVNNTKVYDHSMGGATACRRSGSAGFVFSNNAITYATRSSPSSSAVAIAKNKAIANFGEGSFNAGVFLAELPQTAGFVISSLHRINSFVKFLRKGEFQKALDAVTTSVRLSNRAKRRLNNLDSSRRVADGWLEYQYALKPLISDVYGAIQAYHDTIEVGKFVRTTVGPKRPALRVVDDNQAQSRFPSLPASSSLEPRAPRVTVGGWIGHKGTRTLQSLGLINLAALAWEKQPLSFVIDWFFPIGDYLRSISASAGMSDTWICTVTEQQVYAYLRTAKIWYHTTTTVNRKVTYGSLFGTFPLAATSALSATRITTLAALIKQRSQ